MVYFDNAATTFPKPNSVYKKWQQAMTAFGANPGRSGYTLAQKTGEAVFQSRLKCAEFFGAEAENVVFTLNCTHSLNYAIKGLAKPYKHFVISDMEHNAVVRPINAVAESFGGSFEDYCKVFETAFDAEETLRNANRLIDSDTAAVVCTAASNVIGLRNPLSELYRLCRERKVPFIVDAAQGAGLFPINLRCADIICAAGHKGLYAPMGTGLMITNGRYPLRTLIEGGTGSVSESIEQPEFMPDRFESGTINTAGVIALGEGVSFVKSMTPQKILAHELALCRHFCNAAQRLHNVRLYNVITQRNSHLFAPVVSFNFEGVPSVEGAEMLGNMGFAMRGGLHCAPFAHKKIGTLENGTIRFAPSIFNTQQEVDALIRAMDRIKS